MKKLILVLTVAALLPVYVSAHGEPMMNFGELQTGPEMMEYLEDRVLGDELHEEMEQLMVKMMSGTLTQAEADRISQLMGQYPGPYGMMMNRLNWNDGSGWGMMGGWNNMMGWNQTIGWGIVWLWVLVLSGFIWLAVGVLLLIWLAKKVFSK